MMGSARSRSRLFRGATPGGSGRSDKRRNGGLCLARQPHLESRPSLLSRRPSRGLAIGTAFREQEPPGTLDRRVDQGRAVNRQCGFSSSCTFVQPAFGQRRRGRTLLRVAEWNMRRAGEPQSVQRRRIENQHRAQLGAATVPPHRCVDCHPCRSPSSPSFPFRGPLGTVCNPICAGEQIFQGGQ